LQATGHYHGEKAGEGLLDYVAGQPQRTVDWAITKIRVKKWFQSWVQEQDYMRSNVVLDDHE
jgi:hypothetical protein